jgi:hypothetical protein
MKGWRKRLEREIERKHVRTERARKEAKGFEGMNENNGKREKIC